MSVNWGGGKLAIYDTFLLKILFLNGFIVNFHQLKI